MRAVWYIFLFIGTCFWVLSPVSAQEDSIMLDKHFKFQDGLYLSFSELRQNSPSIAWSEVRAGLYSNPQTYITRVENLRLVAGDSIQQLSTDSIYGFSLGGIPYLYVGRSDDDRFALFSGLQVRGRLCYFAYEKTEKITYDMPVYNPLTGQPYIKGKVDREEKIPIERLLVFQTGEIYDFTLENFKQLIANDSELIYALENLPPDEAFEKMWKCLLIYDDRHPVYVIEGSEGVEGVKGDRKP